MHKQRWQILLIQTYDYQFKVPNYYNVCNKDNESVIYSEKVKFINPLFSVKERVLIAIGTRGGADG